MFLLSGIFSGGIKSRNLTCLGRLQKSLNIVFRLFFYRLLAALGVEGAVVAGRKWGSAKKRAIAIKQHNIAAALYFLLCLQSLSKEKPPERA